MKRVLKRAGAIALASTMFAVSFGTAASGAYAQEVDAQDQAAPADLEDPRNASIVTPEPAIRFVPSEVVQVLPDAQGAVPAAPSQATTLQQLVAQTATSGTMSDELTCLAQAIYFEARGEPLAGQLAVARVIVNRAASAEFPDDYCSVVTQRAQFSFVRAGRIPMPRTSSPAWQRAQAIARIAHRDLWASDAGDALYFHATHVRPVWASRMSTRARIENHIFYR